MSDPTASGGQPVTTNYPVTTSYPVIPNTYYQAPAPRHSNNTAMWIIALFGSLFFVIMMVYAVSASQSSTTPEDPAPAPTAEPEPAPES